jgi:hypothetical protein
VLLRRHIRIHVFIEDAEELPRQKRQEGHADVEERPVDFEEDSL